MGRISLVYLKAMKVV
ncbi:hypothetical protein E2320_005984, partial [Naja naja]